MQAPLPFRIHYWFVRSHLSPIHTHTVAAAQHSISKPYSLSSHLSLQPPPLTHHAPLAHAARGTHFKRIGLLAQAQARTAHRSHTVHTSSVINQHYLVLHREFSHHPRPSLIPSFVPSEPPPIRCMPPACICSRDQHHIAYSATVFVPPPHTSGKICNQLAGMTGQKQLGWCHGEKVQAAGGLTLGGWEQGVNVLACVCVCNVCRKRA